MDFSKVLFPIPNLCFPKVSGWIFALLFLGIALLYDYDRILFEPPQSIHQWRQADCLSLTTNYYQDKNPFFKPSMHYLGIDGTGQTVSDFPIIYYLVAKIWAITGKEVWVYRFVVLLLFFLGLLALMKAIELEIRNSIAGIFVGLLLFTSPVLVYYGSNFLMNIPAFSFACLGLYQFFKFKSTGFNKYLWWLGIFYLLAGLLKVSALLSFVAICLVFLIDLVGIRPKQNAVFRGTWKEAMGLCSVVIIVLLWLTYAQHYNAKHTGGIFLIGILPIWNLSTETIAKTFEYISHHFRWDYFRPFIGIFLAIAAIVVSVFHKSIDSSIRFISAMMCLGALAFMILFFEALMHHDYYVIDLYLLVPVLLLAFFMVLKEKLPRFYRSYLFAFILLAMLIHSLDFANRRIFERYDLQGLSNHDHREIFQAFAEIGPTLKDLNIGPDAKVLSLSDYSINITLYLMNRKGWTDYGISLNPNRIRDKIAMGARYLFIASPETYTQETIAPFIHNKIGSYKNVDIYQLKDVKYYE